MNFILKGVVFTMNKPQESIDQMSQLQHIAYVKQFMRKGSVKVMMGVSVLQAVLGAFISLRISSLFKVFLKYLNDMGTTFSADEMDALNVIEGLTDMISTIGLIGMGISLIFPITLLMIILKANSDDPTVIAKAPVSFLKVLAIIQFAIAIIGSILSLIGTVAILKSGDSGISSAIGSVISTLLQCLFYFYQVKFLSSIRKACDGVTMSSEGAQGVGVYNVIFAICNGLVLIGIVVFAILFNSFANSTQVSSNSVTETISSVGIKSINGFFVMFAIYSVLSMIFEIAYALTAFGYRDMVISIVRAAYANAQGTRTTSQKMFKTYGGGSIHSSYDYSNTGSGVTEQGQNRNLSETDIEQPISSQDVPVQPVVPTAPQTPPPVQQNSVPLTKQPEVNPYQSNMNNNGTFNPNSYQQNMTDNSTFNPNPYPQNMNNNGSFNSNPYPQNLNNNGTFNSNPYPQNMNNNSSFNSNPYQQNMNNNGTFNPNPYPQNMNNGSFNPNPYPQNINNNPYDYQPEQPVGGSSPFDYQPEQPVGGNSPYDYQPAQPIGGNSPYDYQPAQPIGGSSPFDYQPAQPIGGSSPFDYQPEQPIGGNSPFDYQPEQPIDGSSPFDYQPEQPIGGNSPYDYQPEQPVDGSSPFDYQQEEEAPTYSPFDYRPDKSKRSPFDYDPNRNTYSNGGNQ